MYKMVDFEETLNQIRSALVREAPNIGLEYYGVATHIIDINNFYIVPLSLYRLMPALEQPGRPIEDLEEHARVIYNSPTLGMKPVRGMVRAIDNNGSCALFALDYGVMDLNVTRDNIFQLLYADSDNIPGLAQLCELANCFPFRAGQFTEETQTTFKFFMGQVGEKLNVIIKEMTGYKMGVEIISSNSNPDTVSTVMAYCNLSTLFCGFP